MTPTDILPARFSQPADTASVRGVGAKAGNDSGEGDAGFRDLLKQIAGDKSEQKASEANAARGKEAAVHGRARNLENAKAALAELRGRQGGKDGLALDGKDEDIDADDLGGGEETDAALVPTEPKAGEAGAPTNAVAMLMSLAHKGNATPRTQAGAGQSGGAESPDPTLGGDANAATAVADKALRDVKVISVKVETHFAAVHTDAATTSFAQRLALSQMSGTQPGAVADAAKGKAEAKTGVDATAVAGSEKSGDVRQTRGQMFAARADHRGADNNNGAGSGKSGSDGKAAVAAPGVAAAQRNSTPAVDASQAGATATPLQQLSNRLIATAHELQQAASATPASSAGSDAAASAPPVRVLSINLHPEELGSVTVRMSMVAGNLDVQIDAEMPDTAQMLRSDSDQISDMLRSAGIQIDGITVRAASPDFVSTSGGSTGSFFDQQPQSQSGGAPSDGRGSGGQGRGDQNSQSFGRAAGFKQDDESRNQRDRGTGLYV